MFTSRQVINGINLDMDLINDASSGEVYLALSNSSFVGLYSWDRTQFDRVAVKDLKDKVNAVKVFSISGDLYIATAQVNSKSQLLKYHRQAKRSGQLKTHQYLETNYQHTKLQYFLVGANSYLAFAGPDVGRIFWWTGEGFLAFQELDHSQNALDISSLRLVDGEVVIGILYKNRIGFFTQGTDSRFQNVHMKEFNRDTSLRSLHMVPYFGKFLYAFVAGVSLHASPVWKLRLYPQSPSQPTDPLHECIMKLSDEILARENRLRSLSSLANRVWVSDRQQKVTAPVIVHGKVHATGNVNVNEVVISTNLTNLPQITAREIKDRLDKVVRLVDTLQRELPKLARRDKSNVIAGRVTFAHPIVARNAKIARISNPKVAINGLSFDDLTNNVLKLNEEQVIPAKFTFGAGLKANIIEVAGRLNGMKLSDILMKQSPSRQVITGQLTFTNVTIVPPLSLAPSGTINGIHLEDIFTTANTNRPQVIRGVKHFDKVQMASLDVDANVNNMPLNSLASRAVRLTSDKPQVLSGSITFESAVDVESLLVPGLINNRINVTHMLSHGVYRSKDGQVITGKKTFTGKVQVTDSVTVDGRINGLDFNKDIVTLNRPENITTPLVFKAPVTIDGQLETLTVNGIDLSRDAVLRNSPLPQIITARKGFLQGLQVKGDITMDPGSTIDDVDPSKLAQLLISRKNVTLAGPLTFDSIIINGSVDARFGINGRLIHDLPKIAWFRSLDQTIDHPLSFLAPVTFKSVTAASVNGRRVPGDFVLKDSPVSQVITGPKTFLGDVILLGPGVTTDRNVRMNGVDLDEFNRHFVNQVNATSISHIKDFSHIHVKGNIYATKVNGLNLKDDVMISSFEQVVHSPVVFVTSEVEVSHLDVHGDINVNTTTNGIKLRNWARDVVFIDSTGLRPIRNKHFENLQVDTLVAAGKISGIDFDSFVSRVVTLNSSQDIRSNINFIAPVNFGSHVDIGLLNDLNVSLHASRVIRVDENDNRPIRVTGKKVIKGNLILRNRDLKVNGLVDGVNLTRMAENAFFLSQPNRMLSPLTVEGNVSMDKLFLGKMSRLDGVNLDDLVYLNRPGVVDLDMIFEEDVKIQGNLFVDTGIVNGCDMTKLFDDAVRLDVKKAVIRGKTILEVLNIQGNLDVNGTVNELNLKEAYKNAVKTFEAQVITSPMHFMDEVTVDNLIITAPINDVNFNVLLRDAVRKDVPSQVIAGKKEFFNDIVVAGDTATFFSVNVQGKINGVNVTDLRSNSLYLNGDQTIRGVKKFSGPVTFQKSILVGGKIGSGENLIRIPQDLVLLNNTEGVHISGQVRFRNITVVRRNLVVKGLIDQTDLIEMARHRTSLINSQTTSGQLVFREPVKIDQLIVRKTINGIPIGDLVTKSGNHALAGRYKFSQGMLVNGDLVMGPKSTLNGVSIEDIARRFIDVRLGGRVTGTTYIMSKADLGASGLNTSRLNGISVEALHSHFGNYSISVKNKVDRLNRKINDQERQIMDHLNSIRQLSTSVNYIDNYKEFTRDLRNRPIVMTKIVPVTLATANNSSPFTPATYLIGQKLLGVDTHRPSCHIYGSVLYKPKSNGDLDDVTNSLKNGGRHMIYPMTGFTSRNCAPFYVWLNESRCTGRPQMLSTQLIDNLDPLASGPDFLAGPFRNMTLVAALSFSKHPDDFAVVALYNHWRPQDSKVILFSFSSKMLSWSVHQELQAFGVSAIDLIFTPDSRLLLAVAHRLTFHGSPSASVIYQFDTINRNFVRFQAIPSWSPSAIRFAPLNDPLEPSATLLIVANEKAQLYGGECRDEPESELFESSSAFLTQSVVVYKSTGGKFISIQEINVPGVTSIDLFHLPPSGLFLLVASKPLGRSYLYQLRGINLFQEVNSLTSIGVEHINSYWSLSGNLYVTIASSQPEKAKILNVVLSGPSIKLRSNNALSLS